MKSAFITSLSVVLLIGCNASPNQLHGQFSVFTFDNRTFYESPANATNRATIGQGGHGSNSRVYCDTLQGMVLYKSPMTASSNSTPVSVEMPIK
jgi:hypothetical protein